MTGTGLAGTVLISDAEIERFWSKVDRGEPDECWPWKAGVGSFGYGQFWLNALGRGIGAHRFSAYLALGPSDQFVLHSCDNPPCVNPAHLRYGTPGENMADRDVRGRGAAGERQGLSRLTAESVRAMRDAYARGVGTPELGRRFGVHTATAHRAVTGKTWRSVA